MGPRDPGGVQRSVKLVQRREGRGQTAEAQDPYLRRAVVRSGVCDDVVLVRDEAAWNDDARRIPEQGMDNKPLA
jgi:hypothetical protein